jgi:hypothetical protein
MFIKYMVFHMIWFKQAETVCHIQTTTNIPITFNPQQITMVFKILITEPPELINAIISQSNIRTPIQTNMIQAKKAEISSFVSVFAECCL